ncbi:hypothetical protein TNCV_2608661 [Trichonephila clavipes]|uniref:Uncharacterized protein n=1 Tax=Trichonephila clavipes TaxID=2585209 RepID=A0A8X6S742_TRICX|nr:hypothetical protein TNCV_2608661 [Trichonephila clavipes]
MAPWARRLGCVLACYAQIGRGRREEGDPGERTDERSEEEDEKSRERTVGRRRERRRQERRRKKRAESGIEVKKTMNAGGVENGI